MAPEIEVSTIIPTYNRRDLLLRAVDSVLAQTHPVDEIIVVDDGSTDGTQPALEERYGRLVRCVPQPNRGVSFARNTGLALARGRFFALLDSDDEWHPRKTELQLGWLKAHPGFGMVLCDVQRVDDSHRPVDVLHRRAAIPEDGWVLQRVIADPVFVPASAMFMREVIDDVGGFDETLRTAEDIDFHLRVAERWRVGVVDAGPLVNAMRGHDGLSAGPGTYDDYVAVVQRAVARSRGVIDGHQLDAALAKTYARNSRGMLISGRWRDAGRLWKQAWDLDRSPAARKHLLSLLPFAAKRLFNAMRPRLGR